MRELAVRLARENSSWGYLRIAGELHKLGIAVSATSVRNILIRAGLPPAPRRDSHSWRDFLRAHGESILACDFLTVDTVWLQRLYVLVFISIGSRRIQYLACTGSPNTAWMLRQARNLLTELDDRNQPMRFLILDRDARFPAAFLTLLASGLSNAELGARLYLSEPTIKTHLSSIFRKLRVRDRVQAVIAAYDAGLVEPAIRTGRQSL